MKKNSIPSFPHYYYFSLPIEFKEPLKLLAKYKRIVVKPNNGTGGRGISVVDNQKQLKKEINALAHNTGRFAISPFFDYKEEYRLIILNGKLELCYLKEREGVIGDGKNNLKKLIKVNQFKNVNLLP